MIEINNITGLTFSAVCHDISNIYKRSGNKNVYEEVIDALILEKYSDNLELTSHIKSLPLSEKRVAILSLLDSDNHSWEKLREKIQGNRVSKVDHLKDLIKSFRDFIKVADVERKRHGEIMTPFDELARPMVDLVEKYDADFWKNPNHKVLDSSAGIGTFLIICAAKFMTGLKDWQPDPELRFKHIVENCLYYGELQSRNAFLWLCAVDPYDEYKTNTYWGSFLVDDFNKHMKDVWKVDKFDLIIQNPPYQKSADGKTAATDKPIWHFFVDKSIRLLGDNAKMVMVHPSGWRSVKSFKPIKDELLSRNLLFLKMHSFKQGQEMFNAAINFDYYYLENKKYNGLTDIICEDNTLLQMDISSFHIIPSENIEEITSLFAKDGEERVSILSNSSYHTQKDFIDKEESDMNRYPCVYTVRTNNQPTVRWSSVNNRGHFNIPKVIFARGASGVICDKNGDYGLTEFAYGIVDDVKNIEDIKNVIGSEYFIKKIMLFKNSLGDRYNRKLISLFKKDFWKYMPSKIKITLDNKEDLEFYGKISYDVVDFANNFICYKIELSKQYSKLLSSKGIKICKHYSNECPTIFDGNLSDLEIKKIKDKYLVYYLHRRNKITVQQKEDFYIFLKNLVSNSSDIDVKEFAQEDINDQLIIKELRIFDINNNLLRTEIYKDGNIFSDDDIKDIKIDRILNDRY